MPTTPLSLQDAIAAWLTATQAAPAPEPTPDFRTTTTPADGLVDMAKPSQPKVDWQALALAAQGTTNARAQMEAMAALPAPTPWTNTGIRAAGGIIGALPGVFTANPPLAVAGSALGVSLASNEIAQPREVQQGTRDGVNPLVGYTEGAASMLPISALRAGQPLLGQLPRVAGSAAAGAGAGSVGVQLAETGTVDPMRTLQETAFGTALGTAIPVGVRGVQAVPGAVRAIGEMPAVQRVLADETGAVGPNIRTALPQQPDASPGGGAKPPVVTADAKTINQKTWYHGTAARGMSSRTVNPDASNPAGLFGPGFYMTDDPGVAASYAATRGQGTDGVRYQARVNVSNVLDLTQPAPPEIRTAIQELLDGYSPYETPTKLPDNAKTETLVKLFKEELDGHYDLTDSNAMYDLLEVFRSRGYDALTHLGGVRVGDKPHHVLILLDPNKAGQAPHITQMYPTPLASGPHSDVPMPHTPTERVGDVLRPTKTKAPTRVAQPEVIVPPPVPEGGSVMLDAERLAQSPGTHVFQNASGTTTIRIGKDAVRAGNADPPAQPPAPPAASAAPERGPRQPYSPERPLDPLNLPERIEARREPTPAWIAEDIERSYRYNTEILGMDETMARQSAEATVTPEAIARRQNIMPISEMQARANTIDAMDLPNAKGTTLNAPQQLALADTQRAAADQVRNINERIGGSMADLEAGVVAGKPEAITRMQEVASALGVEGLAGIKRARLEAADLMARLQLFGKATRSEWGRAGRAMQVEAKSRNLDDAAFLKKAYEMGAPTDEAIEALDRLRGNPAAQRQYLEDLFKPSGQQMWKAYLANNMLSGVPTLGVNIVSNLTRLAQAEIARVQVAGLDRLAGTREVALPPPQLLAKSYADGMRHAGKAFLQAMWEGHTPLDDTIAVNVGEVFKGHWLSTALAKSGVEQELADRFGRLAVNKWKRILVGTDAAFQMMGIYPESYRRATAEALNQGLKGQALADAIRERVRAFDYHADADKAVRDYAKQVTFAGDMGAIGQAFQRFVNSVDGGTVRIADKMHAIRTGQKVGEDFKSGSKYGLVQFPVGFLHFPFVRIGAQLWGQAVGLLTDVPRAGVNLAAGQGNRAENLQRLVESANAYMVMGTFAGLYGAGIIDFTTRPPENDFERERFYGVEGKQPWSIGINGRYYPLATFGPLGSALAPLAAYLKGVGSDDDATRAQRFSETTAAIAKMQLDGTLVRTAMQTFEGLTDENKQGRLFGNYVAPFIPEGSFLRNTRDVTDGTLRDPKTFGDEVKALLPGASTTVDPRLDAWGQDVQRQSVMKRVAGSAPMGEDYVGQELVALKESLPDLGRMDEGVYPPDLKASATAFQKTLEGALNKGVTNEADGFKVRFTDADTLKYMQYIGQSVHETLAAVITPDNPEWTALSPAEKRALVRKLKAMGKDMGEELFLAEWSPE